MKQKVFVFFSVVFIGAAIYHLVAVFRPGTNAEPLSRNILFIFINLVGAWGIIKRPKWFIYFFFIWMLQQLYTHGSEVWQGWNQDNKIYWLMATPLFVMPLAFVFLLLERKGRLR